MFNYLVKVAYDGTNFHGWAKQKNTRTVQQAIEDSLKQVFDEQINIFCSGRTDAFVHAKEQYFNFHTRKEWKTKNLQMALNNVLPNDIVVNKIKIVDKKFHARFCAKSKTYVYVINTRFNIFKQNYELFYPKKINLEKIKQIAKEFIGKHDFLSFSRSTIIDTQRTINFIRIKKDKTRINIHINGNGFLRNMVRMIVGSLLDVNENKKQLTISKNY